MNDEKKRVYAEKLKIVYEFFCVLEAVGECDGAPESSIMMGLGGDYDKTIRMLTSLKEMGAITVKHHLVNRGPTFEERLEMFRKCIPDDLLKRPA